MSFSRVEVKYRSLLAKFFTAKCDDPIFYDDDGFIMQPHVLSTETTTKNHVIDVNLCATKTTKARTCPRLYQRTHKKHNFFKEFLLKYYSFSDDTTFGCDSIFR